MYDRLEKKSKRVDRTFFCYSDFQRLRLYTTGDTRISVILAQKKKKKKKLIQTLLVYAACTYATLFLLKL